jgi:alpha-beta hydrolase superfamily lysophospholipase
MTSIFDHDAFNRALFFPRRDASAPPDGAIDRFVDVGGAKLHIRQHAAPTARCTLLLFHGNGEVVADYDGAAPLFADAGAALAVADYRGYGRSTGTPTLRSLIGDARAVAATIDTPFLVMGRSLGGVAAHELFARPVPNMLGVVLESALFDLRALIRRRGLEPPATFTEDELATFEPAPKLRAGTLPLLILHGAEDTLIVPDEARAAFAVAGSARKQLVFVPGRGHNDVSAVDRYWDALADHVQAL